MREILFKAKRLDNGEWVEGNLITNERNENQKYIGYIFDERNGVIEDFDLVEVIPDTICQYTGLTDKNGQKVWENDILALDDIKWIVAWSASECCYAVKDITNNVSIGLLNIVKIKSVVMGNIFDNADLLEVE